MLHILGKTFRHMKVRVWKHQGVSPRTGKHLRGTLSISVRDHILDCNHMVAWDEFKLLGRESIQQTFQRPFNVAFRLIWRRDVAQRQINVETTFCTSRLKFTTFKNVETTLYSPTLNWTKLDNVETTLSFSASIFTTLGNVETTLRISPFGKKIRPWFKNKIIFLSFKEYGGIKIFIFSHFKSNL